MESLLITRDDVIREGACPEGVYEWAGRFAAGLTAIPVDAALRLCRQNKEVRRWVLRTAGLLGYGGYGYGGYGGGYGYGDGYGGYDGYDGGGGYGYGNGGDGYGYGDGYGGYDGGYRGGFNE